MKSDPILHHPRLNEYVEGVELDQTVPNRRRFKAERRINEG